MRSFFRYLLRERAVSANPAVAAPKARKRLPDTLDADRMTRLIEIEGEGPLVERDRAILELLYSSGLRLSELKDLDLLDIDLADATVRVTGKGSKDRIVPVGRFARNALKGWLKARAALANPDETAVFVSQRGTRLSTRSIQDRLKFFGIFAVSSAIIPLRRTCWSRATTSAASRNFSGMRTFPQRRCTRTLISST